jgi:hypothetical protein
MSMGKREVPVEYTAPQRDDVTVVIDSLKIEPPIILKSGDKLSLVVDRADKRTSPQEMPGR